MSAEMMRVVSSLTTVLLLTACSRSVSGVEIPSGWATLKACKYSHTIRVEKLADIGEPGCDMAGAKVRLPDGSPMEVTSIGGIAASGFSSDEDETESISDQFTTVNWGVPGISVAENDRNGRLRKIWAATPEASELASELAHSQEALD